MKAMFNTLTSAKSRRQSSVKKLLKRGQTFGCPLVAGGSERNEAAPLIFDGNRFPLRIPLKDGEDHLFIFMTTLGVN